MTSSMMVSSWLIWNTRLIWVNSRSWRRKLPRVKMCQELPAERESLGWCVVLQLRSAKIPSRVRDRAQRKEDRDRPNWRARDEEDGPEGCTRDAEYDNAPP